MSISSAHKNDQSACYSIEAVEGASEFLYTFTGCWDTDNIGKLSAISFPQHSHSPYEVILDCSQISAVDTAGALLFRDLIKKLLTQHIPYSFVSCSVEMGKVLELVEDFYQEIPVPHAPPLGISRILIGIGKGTEGQLKEFLGLLSFLGQVMCQIGNLCLFRKKFKFISFLSHIEQDGLKALPIVSLLSFLIGVVLAYQGITQLARFGAEIFTVNLLAVGVLREVGILMTAIIVAGRSGSAFTAQIGTMVLNEEVAALRTMGVDPVDVLVLPRMLALILVLPILGLFADIMGLLGGAFMTYVFLDLSFVQFTTQFKSALAPSTFWVGMVKAPFFAFIIGLVGCYEGLCVRSSAQSVGLHTTKSVVRSIFLVIVIDAIFSIVFAQLKI